jgi:hypothetical protein
MTTYNDLPIQIQNKIIRLLDIDTRRKLGIYVKLKIPNNLASKLSNIEKIKKFETIFEINFIVCVYPYIIKHIMNTNKYIYCIYNIESTYCHYYSNIGYDKIMPRLLYDSE